MLWLRYSRCWPELPKVEDVLAEQSGTVSIVISSVIVQFRPRSPILKYTQTRIVDVDQKRFYLFDIPRRIWQRVPSAKQTSQPLRRQQGMYPFGCGRGASMTLCVQAPFVFLCSGYCCCDWELYTCLSVVSCSCASIVNCRIIIYVSLILLVLIYVRHISRIDATAPPALPSSMLLDGMELEVVSTHGPSHQQELLRAKRCKAHSQERFFCAFRVNTCPS